MDFRTIQGKFRDVRYLEKLLARCTDELKGKRQKLEDIEQTLMCLMLYATNTVHLQFVNSDLERQQFETEVQINDLEEIVEDLEIEIKERRGHI